MAELEDDRGADLQIETGTGAAGEPVISLAGDLDISSVDGVREVVTQATAGAPAVVVFDLERLRFLDSAGISVLLAAAREVPSVRLRRPSKVVRRVVELTGLSEVLVIEQ